jgi:hypothetical protein
LRLGLLLEKRGDLAGAVAAYERAVESGQAQGGSSATGQRSKVLGKAAGNLGMLRAEQGDAAGARAAFERMVIECGCGCDEVAPEVARSLARLHRRRWPRLLYRRTEPVVDRLRQRIRRGASRRIVRVSVPFHLQQDVGLGDALERLISKLGVESCAACQERAAALNRYVVFTGRPLAGR